VDKKFYLEPRRPGMMDQKKQVADSPWRELRTGRNNSSGKQESRNGISEIEGKVGR
jgi:hypothetical protein